MQAYRSWNILEDWARKTSLEIVRFAKRLGYQSLERI
jgi:hypothetical protein